MVPSVSHDAVRPEHANRRLTRDLLFSSVSLAAGALHGIGLYGA
jgi:hypothetical protein